MNFSLEIGEVKATEIIGMANQIMEQGRVVFRSKYIFLYLFRVMKAKC